MIPVLWMLYCNICKVVPFRVGNSFRWIKNYMCVEEGTGATLSLLGDWLLLWWKCGDHTDRKEWIWNIFWVFRSWKSPKKELVYQGTGWEWRKNQALREITRYSWPPTIDPRTQSGCPWQHSDESCWEEGIVVQSQRPTRLIRWFSKWLK